MTRMGVVGKGKGIGRHVRSVPTRVFLCMEDQHCELCLQLYQCS